MKVFLSWSGVRSKNIAEILRQWLPSVIQVVKPYYSPDDIAKGSRWSSEIALELDDSRLGLICLTKENLLSPWIMFEAGALSKKIDNSKVCPILFGVEPSDIQGPLVQFQAAKFTRDEIKRVVRMMNVELGENSLTSEVFESVFEMWWPKLEEKIVTEMGRPLDPSVENVRSDRDMLEEILSLSRNITLSQGRGRGGVHGIHPGAISELVSVYTSLIHAIIEQDNKDIIVAADQLFRPLEHLMRRADTSGNLKENLRRDLEVTYVRLKEFDASRGYGVSTSSAGRGHIRRSEQEEIEDGL